MRFKATGGQATVTGFSNVHGDGIMNVPATITYDGQTYTVVKIGEGKQLDWDDQIKQLKVTGEDIAIADNALKNEGHLQSVDLACVKTLYVGKYAFENSTNVERVALPADVDGNTVVIDSAAFRNTGRDKAPYTMTLQAQGQSHFIFEGEPMSHFYGSNIHVNGYQR